MLDYTYFKKYHKLIAINLSKQQAVDANPKAMQKINHTGNLDLPENTVFFIIEEAKALANNASANKKLSKTQLS